ncbi:MAG: radical SAM protein [Verrucomicrobiota bacterium]
MNSPGAPRLLLVTASAPDIRRVRRARVLNFQQITMPYLAAFVPPDWSVQHVDEAVQPVDTKAAVDLVAITFHTPSAPHVYAMADQFRQRGVTVALGGPHVTLLPGEAQEHADAIFVGEAEEEWPRFLRDFAAGRHAARYEAAEAPSLDSAPMARKDLFHRRDHTAGVLFATRGCPYHCDFCTVAVMSQSRFRKRPVQAVAREFGSFGGRVIILWDDNIACDRDYAKALFRELAPHRKWWSCQASIHAGDDDEFLDLAARSGCKQLFIGLESVSQASVNGVSKGFNRVAEYARAIDRIHAHGIAVQAGLVFGFDHDTPPVFAQTLDFLETAGVQNATFNILTPFPGTPLFARLESEGRILTRDWNRYNGRADVVYQPLGMTPEQLLEGYRYANRRFYSLNSIRKRLGRSPTGLWWTLPLNLAYAAAWNRR